MNPEKQIELRDKIIAGLEMAYVRMLESKRQKNGVVVIGRDGNVITIKP